ncbi:MAG: prephenate dehydrogenase/arogenate dehydrogenase family protein [Candidatus Omnitrophica bacterium]|nr:prephenate dehydrogenase/arogenate dehydrogenase family protein [Candidatus Omnitrophota bacterium]
MRLFNKVEIIGVGLIGGSLGFALRKRKLVDEIAGVCRHRDSVNLAKKCGAIDEGYEDIEKAVLDRDLVILATPVSQIIEIIPRLTHFLKKGAIVTDVGSTKVEIVKQGEKFLSPRAYFVGAHPLAGSEKRGVKEAREEIFENAFCILTPTSRTDKTSLRKIIQLWEAVGAKIEIMGPQEHDRIVAQISHLPHVLAINLILSLERRLIRWGAGGLRDVTRIASSDPFIWQDIFLTNQREIVKAIKKFRATLQNFSSLLSRKDKEKIFALLEKAREKRNILSE